MTIPDQEELQQHYSALFDSLDVIESLKFSTVEADIDAVARNKYHINVMIGKGWFNEGFDLNPFQEVIEDFEQ
jgi:hypothetical protein